MFLEKLSSFVYHLSKYFLIFLVGSMSLIIIVQVFCRTFLGFSIFWSEEYARYCLVWSTFIGASMAVRNKELAMFDLLIEKMSEKWKWLYLSMIDLLVLTFILIAIYFGFKQIFTPTVLMQVSPALRMPVWILYLSVPIGCIFMSIHLLNSMAQHILTRKQGEEQ